MTDVGQARFRGAIAAGWGIRPGASVLEIGCGQGDMTAVLAEVVGEHGRVVAVDKAEPTYGAPVTIGDATRRLRASALGPRLDVRLGFDVLDPANHLPADAFDHVVLSLSSWYFDSVDVLRDTLRTVRTWAPVLCFAEWDLRPGDARPLAHLLAVLVQGQAHARGLVADGNVRTPVSREVLLGVLDETGWHVDRQGGLDTAGLADADWEIDAALRLAPLLGAGTELLASQLDVLRSVAAGSGNRPLPAYYLVARRA